MTERLWAPWRYDYVSAPKAGAEGCVFCGIGSSDTVEDSENLVLHRGSHVYAVLNRFPYINGHMMVVPYRHEPELGGLSPEESEELFRVLAAGETALKEGMKCQGMNGGWNAGSAGGAGIPGHLPVHLLPRWSGDTNFMSTVGGIRVVSQSLKKAHEILSPWFRKVLD